MCMMMSVQQRHLEYLLLDFLIEMDVTKEILYKVQLRILVVLSLNKE